MVAPKADASPHRAGNAGDNVKEAAQGVGRERTATSLIENVAPKASVRRILCLRRWLASCVPKVRSSPDGVNLSPPPSRTPAAWLPHPTPRPGLYGDPVITTGTTPTKPPIKGSRRTR